MKKWICLLLAVLLAAALFWTGRRVTTQHEVDALRVYVVSDNIHTGSGLVWEYRQADPEQDTVQQLIEWLLSEPEQAEHQSAVPGGVTLLSRELKDGILVLNFSEGYGDLSGAARSLANGAVVLTMTQLETVNGVIIQSAGEPVTGKLSLPLTAEMYDLSGRSADPIVLALQLYFLTADGTEAVAESREIQASDDTPATEVRAVLDALCAGPETEALQSPYPPANDEVSLTVRERRCVLSVDEQWRDILLDPQGKATLTAWALSASLTGLDGIDQIVYQYNGAEIPGLSEAEIAASYNQ